MPVIHAASVSTEKGRVATIKEHHENGDEYSYYFKSGVIRVASFTSHDQRLHSQMEYVFQKRDDDLCLIDLQTESTFNRHKSHRESITIRADQDHESFNRRLKFIFESYVEERKKVADEAS